MSRAVRVVDARLVEQAGDLSNGAANAHTEWTHRKGIVLELRDDAGHVGRGEASSLPRYSRDDHATALEALERAPWERVGPITLESPVHQAIAPALDAVGDTSPAARFAVETAFLDLVGQATAHPVWALLDPRLPPPSRVPLAFLVPATVEPAELVAAAQDAVARGYRTLKVKIGRPGAFDDELLALQAMRMAVGDGVSIRLDANGTLVAGLHGEREAALGKRLDALAAIGPELVEEPAAIEALLLSRNPAVPFALDETLLRPDAEGLLDRAIATGHCKAVVLKPMALGGLDRCIAFADRARVHGVVPIVSHLFDGPVAWAAAAQLALLLAARPGARLAQGLAPHVALEAWPDVPLPSFDGVELVPSGRAGLGLPLDIRWRPAPPRRRDVEAPRV